MDRRYLVMESAKNLSAMLRCHPWCDGGDANSPDATIIAVAQSHAHPGEARGTISPTVSVPIPAQFHQLRRKAFSPDVMLQQALNVILDEVIDFMARKRT